MGRISELVSKAADKKPETVAAKVGVENRTNKQSTAQDNNASMPKFRPATAPAADTAPTEEDGRNENRVVYVYSISSDDDMAIGEELGPKVEDMHKAMDLTESLVNAFGEHATRLFLEACMTSIESAGKEQEGERRKDKEKQQPSQVQVLSARMKAIAEKQPSKFAELKRSPEDANAPGPTKRRRMDDKKTGRAVAIENEDKEVEAEKNNKMERTKADFRPGDLAFKDVATRIKSNDGAKASSEGGIMKRTLRNRRAMGPFVEEDESDN